MFNKIKSLFSGRRSPQEPQANPLIARIMPRAQQSEANQAATDAGSQTPVAPAASPVVDAGAGASNSAAPTQPKVEPLAAGAASNSQGEPSSPSQDKLTEPKAQPVADRENTPEAKVKKPRSEPVEKIGRKIILDVAKYSELLERINGTGKDAGRMALGEFIAISDGGNSVKYRFCEYHGGKNNQTARDFDYPAPVVLAKTESGRFKFEPGGAGTPTIEAGKLVLAEVRRRNNEPTRIGFVPLKGSEELEALVREVAGVASANDVKTSKKTESSASQAAPKKVDEPNADAAKGAAGAPLEDEKSKQEPQVKEKEDEKKATDGARPPSPVVTPAPAVEQLSLGEEFFYARFGADRPTVQEPVDLMVNKELAQGDPATGLIDEKKK